MKEWLAEMMPEQNARDPFESGLFPLCVATHDQGIRLLFDLATLILLLDCRPGDRVLDLGSGSGFASEMLARLGYNVVAGDPDLPALRHNRQRPTFDRSRIAGEVRVAAAVAEYLPFGDETFDGVLGMNVLHHVADLSRAVTELARVLKPGRRAVFCEPGLDHLAAPETVRAVREHGENDRAFDVLEFLRVARANGFREAMLAATLQSPLSLLRVEEIDIFLSGRHPRRHLTLEGILEEVHRRHAYSMLIKAGEAARTSRHPGRLRHELAVNGLPGKALAGDSLTAMVHVSNVGDTVWLASPSAVGGFVTVGCKLAAEDGRVISDALGRTELPADVGPGENASVIVTLSLPRDLSPGLYTLSFDLVNELVCWFSDLGNVPITHSLSVSVSPG
jgi:SAM-dependent methyltransferase